MAAGNVQTAKRALVQNLLSVAALYSLAATLNCDSADKVVMRVHRRVLLHVRSTNGEGKQNDIDRLEAVHTKWDEARTRPQNRARPWEGGAATGDVDSEMPQGKPREFRIHAAAVLFTYQGIAGLLGWTRFVAFVEGNIRNWGLKHWCATLEPNTSGTYHTHLMLQFYKKIDRVSRAFCFEEIPPRADQNGNDLCGEGISGRKAQESIDRGMFYVWADKLGTARDALGNPCVAGNYAPCWTDAKCKYQVLGRWPERLWKQRKLSHAKFEECFCLLGKHKTTTQHNKSTRILFC